MSSIEHLEGNLRGAGRILLSTHQSPDGDGIGTQLALLAVLEQLGKRVQVINDGPIAQRFQFLAGSEAALDWRNLTPPAREAALRELDLALVVDTHEWTMLGQLAEPLRASGIPTFFLDHHPLIGPAREDQVCDPSASSTAEASWPLLLRLEATITPAVATCLYAGIMYDTNSFKYLRRRPETHRLAAELMQHGADTDAIYRHMFASDSPAWIVFLGEILQSLHLCEDGRVAWAVISREMVARTGVSVDELRDTITQLLEIRGVELAFTLHEREGGHYKVSLRSMGTAPVSPIAFSLGGGGHLFAAGAYVDGPLEAAIGRVLGLVQEQVARSLPARARPPARAD